METKDQNVMEVEPRVNSPKKFKTILEVLEDERFERFLSESMNKAFNPPPPPPGKIYKHKPWERLKRFHIDSPAAILREYSLILSRKSMENMQMRTFIQAIVQNAVSATIISYNLQDN